MAVQKPPGISGKTIAPLVLKAASASAKAPGIVTLKAAGLTGAKPSSIVGLKAPGLPGAKPSSIVGPKAPGLVGAKAGAKGAAKGAAKAKAAPIGTPVAKGITGNQYRDLIASYIHHNYASQGLVVYVEISLGKTVIGKDRCIDVFVVRPDDRKAIAIECKYQDSLGTVDEKIPYALLDLDALWVPGCLVYAGKGWSKGVLHSLEASRNAAYCMPDPTTLHRSKVTRELDHMLAAIFGFWDLVLPANRRFKPLGS